MVVCKRERTPKKRTMGKSSADESGQQHNTASIQGGRDALNHGVDGLAIRVDETEVVPDRVKTPQNRVFFHAVALVFAGDPLARFLFELDLILMQ